ncbi:hypothetical protein [Vibrio vulnificus]|uniref:hypothetical protein n=1 Tax=Vibrio vulnificus TaxID=672 RepID=UPI0032427695
MNYEQRRKAYLSGETNVDFVDKEAMYEKYLAIDRPSKAGYNKEQQSFIHIQRRSMALRTSPMWDHYEKLYVDWKFLDMPDEWTFKNYVVKRYPHLQDVKTFRYQNMVKMFGKNYEYDLKKSAEETRSRTCTQDENVDFEHGKPLKWEDTVNEKVYVDDPTFGRIFN